MRLRRQAEHPRVPAVNLLSPWALDALETRRLRRRFAFAAAALVLLLGLAWSVQHLRVTQARQVLAVEQAETDRLDARTAELAPVRSYVAAVDQRRETVRTTMAQDVRLSTVLSELLRVTPAGARLESISVTLVRTEAGAAAVPDDGATAPPADSSPCPGPDPFRTRTLVGCITLSGTAGTRASVGRFVAELGRGDLFVEPFISTTTTVEQQGVTFNGSVGLSAAAYSRRYDRLQSTAQVTAR